ncbi:BQ2448_2127 [Microbotryum intermedium]|uniref:BQ2448_2127 protein n=1 Tax=Microbotryum intermedium TaxID=269621 RepID=A0A238F7I1_9BASI|nr:BQ2448_2127 [Microbotryum intermedium]
MPLQLEDIPPELLAYILSFCTLPSSLALARTSSWVRHNLKHSMQWAFPLIRASIDCQANVVYVDQPLKEIRFSCADEDHRHEWDALSGFAGHDWSIGTLVPDAVWVKVLSQLTRGMLLKMEMPRLKQPDWADVATRRFATSLIYKEHHLGEHEVHHWHDECTRVRKGRWKSAFMSHINAFQHSSTTRCHSEHNCYYVVHHRLAGMLENRTAFRTFDALTIFRELKRENNLSRYTTVQLTIKDELVPRDLRVHVYCSIGRSDAFLKNEIAMEVLTRVGCWTEHPRTTTVEHAILGPVLITATIRPDSSTTRTTQVGQMDELVPLVDASFRRSDFLQVCAKADMGRDWWAEKGVSQKPELGFA